MSGSSPPKQPVEEKAFTMDGMLRPDKSVWVAVILLVVALIAQDVLADAGLIWAIITLLIAVATYLSWTWILASKRRLWIFWAVMGLYVVVILVTAYQPKRDELPMARESNRSSLQDSEKVDPKIREILLSYDPFVAFELTKPHHAIVTGQVRFLL